MAVHDMLMAAGGVSTGPATYIDDVFSTYLYTGNGSSQPIENGINLGTSNSGGSAYFDGSTSYIYTNGGTACSFGTGDFTIEAWVYVTAGSNGGIVGMRPAGTNGAYPNLRYGTFSNNGVDYTGFIFFVNDGGTGTMQSGVAVTAGQWYHVAVSRSGTTSRLFVNGSQVASTTDNNNYSCGTNRPLTGAEDWNNSPNLNGYVSNVRIVKGTAVYTSSFTPSTTPLTAISGTSYLICQGDAPFTDNSSNHFSITQTGSPTSKKFGPFTSDTAGKGGMVWLKRRDGIGSNGIIDTVRGGQSQLATNLTNAANTGTDYINPFNTNGFTLGTANFNGSSQTLVSWTFRKQAKFFDVVTFTTDSSGDNYNIPHNLGSRPGFIIVKRTNGTSDWYAGQRGTSTSGNFDYNLKLNTTGADLGSAIFQDVTSTNFMFIGSGDPSPSGSLASGTFVAYIYAHDAGGFGTAGTDNVISCGSYTVDASQNKVTVNLGYEPQWLMIKRADSTSNWFMFDNMRNIVTGGDDSQLYANSSSLEVNNADAINLTATGFETGANATVLQPSATYIYIAIRRGPMKTPTTGTSVFDAGTRSGSASDALTNSDILTDLAVTKNYSSGAEYWAWTPRLAGQYTLQSNSTDAELSGAMTSNPWDTMVGAECAASNGATNSGSLIDYSFRRAPGFFDVVCYTGTGVVQTINHNLTVAPELMIVKDRGPNSGSWRVYSNTLGPTKGITLNLANAAFTLSTIWNDTAPTSSVFTVGTYTDVNNSGDTYVAYLFATVAGVSKVGSYTGTGTTNQINCGFTGGARFVLIKRTDSTGDWYVWDSARGIVAGNDPYLLLNSTAAEVTNTDYVDTYAAGFEISSTAPAAINANGGSYIYLAIS